MKNFISKIKFGLWCLELDLHYFLNRFDLETILGIMYIIGNVFLLIVVIHPEWFFQFIPEISISLTFSDFIVLTVFGSYIMGAIIGSIILLMYGK